MNEKVQNIAWLLRQLADQLDTGTDHDTLKWLHQFVADMREFIERKDPEILSQGASAANAGTGLLGP